MKQTEEEAYNLVDECIKCINNGNVNSYASYEEGVKDAILWLLCGDQKPYIGREV